MTPTSTGRFGNLTSLDSIQTVKIDSNVFLINGQRPDNSTPLQAPSGSISKLDLKSPPKARHEYEKGYQLLMKKDLEAAITHLTKSIAVRVSVKSPTEFSAKEVHIESRPKNHANPGRALSPDVR